MLTSALLATVAAAFAQAPGGMPPPPDRPPPPGAPFPPPPPPPPPPPAFAGQAPAPTSGPDRSTSSTTPTTSIAAPADDGAVGQALDAVNVARRDGDQAALAASLLQLADVLDAHSRTRESLPALQEVIAIADARDDERLGQRAATQLAMLDAKLGDHAAAAFWQRRADAYRDRFTSRLLPVQPVSSTVAATPGTSVPAAKFPTSPAAPPEPAAPVREESHGYARWLITGLFGLLLIAWWHTRRRAAHLESETVLLQKRQQRAQTVAARLQAESEQLRKQAVQDMLTGALTRQAFASSLKEMLVHASHYGRPVALLVMDLDHFKSINDQYGHLSGDAALKLVVGITRENLGSGDLLGRFGGDEFLIAAIDHDAAMSLALGETIRKAVAQRAGATSALAQLRVSIGVAHATPASGYDLESLFRRADAALYAAKRAGRDRVAIETEGSAAPLDQPALRQLSTESTTNSH